MRWLASLASRIGRLIPPATLIGKHIMEKTGNAAAVQRQLGHRNAIYSMQYSRITADELGEVINNR